MTLLQSALGRKPRLLVLVYGLLFLALSSSFADITIHGDPYMSVRDLGRALKMQYRVVQLNKEVRLSNKKNTLTFKVHDKGFSLNGTRVFLGAPVVLRGGRFYVSRLDYERLILPILYPEKSANPPKLYHILLDAGHGGKDQGTESKRHKLKEKNLALDLTRKLQKRLEARGYRVTLTRSRDEFVALIDRSRKANRVNADLFVSLHFNAAQNVKAAGVETYVLTLPGQASTSRDKKVAADNKTYAGNRYDSWNALLGYYVQRSLAQGMSVPDRGLKHARFAVLKDLQCPGILIEGGFLSNDTEARNLGSAAYRDKMAERIADGIIAYQMALNRVRR